MVLTKAVIHSTTRTPRACMSETMRPKLGYRVGDGTKVL
jgi:hypothetical protein